MGTINMDQLTVLVDKYKADTKSFTRFFCMKCFSKYVYVRRKTKDFVCRKCGNVTLIKSFDDFIILFRTRKNNIKGR